MRPNKDIYLAESIKRLHLIGAVRVGLRFEPGLPQGFFAMTSIYSLLQLFFLSFFPGFLLVLYM